MTWRERNEEDAKTHGATVLIVEDEKLARRALVALLNVSGYQVLAAESAEKAIYLVKHIAVPAFALVDFSLPGMDGLTLIQILRAIPTDVFPILMTSDDHEEVVTRALSDSVTYMRKPIDIGRILTVFSDHASVHS